MLAELQSSSRNNLEFVVVHSMVLVISEFDVVVEVRIIILNSYPRWDNSWQYIVPSEFDVLNSYPRWKNSL